MRKDVVCQRIDRREDGPRFGTFGDANAEMLFDTHRELKRVERIEAQAFTEKGCRVAP